MSSTKRAVLYISYDGMLEPIGRSQVIQYLRKLGDSFEFHLISYEKPPDFRDRDRMAELQRTLRDSDITWYPLQYRRGRASVAWNIARGILLSLRTTSRQGVSIVHCRGYVPTFIGFFTRVLLGTKIVFDMRGFWGDERLAIGKWTRTHPVYRTIKFLERLFLRHADHTVSLTRSGVEAIRAFPYMAGRQLSASVISTCTDLDHFRISPTRPVLRKRSKVVVGYVGNTSNSYLLDPLRVALEALISELAPQGIGVKLLVVSHAAQAAFAPHLPKGLSGVEFHESTYDEMPSWISRMDVVVFFLNPSFAKRGSVPTKLGEILACGRPILTNSGHGDIESTLLPKAVGVVARDLSNEEIAAAVRELLQLMDDPDLAARCRQQAEDEFSLEKGTRRLKQIYAGL
jgi:glycosyltransferase involved in cell wall biosynthesis